MSSKVNEKSIFEAKKSIEINEIGALVPNFKRSACNLDCPAILLPILQGVRLLGPNNLPGFPLSVLCEIISSAFQWCCSSDLVSRESGSPVQFDSSVPVLESQEQF